MLNTLIEGLREVIGVPTFYIDGSIDFGSVIEYMVAALVLLIVVGSIFKILVRWFDR